MAKIDNIPIQIKPGIKYLLNSGKKVRDDLITNLKSLNDNFKFSDLIYKVKDTLDCSSEDANNIGRFIFGIFQLNTKSYLPKSIISEEVCSLLEKHDESGIKLKKSECSDFKLFISELLNITNIEATVKGIDLGFDYQYIFENATILTDFRPIYDFDLNKNISRGLISHILKIAYTDKSDDMSIYLTLDKDDLNELKERIERALKKESNIRKSLGDKITFFDIE